MKIARIAHKSKKGTQGVPADIQETPSLPRSASSEPKNIVNKIFTERISRIELEQKYRDLLTDQCRLEDLCDAVQRCYECDSQLKDGYSKLAMILLSGGNSSRALALWDLDRKLSRITWWQELRYAEALLEHNGPCAALDHVSHVYESHPEALNGFAALGWRLRERSESDALDLFSKDLRQHRITPGYRLNYAVTLARARKYVAALEQVNEAYTADTSLQDGYSRLAWEYATQGDLSTSIELFRKDINAGRCSTVWAIRFVDTLLQSGHSDKALEAARELTLESFNAVIAESGLIESMLAHNQVSEAAERVRSIATDFPQRFIQLACLVALNMKDAGQDKEALDLIEEAYAALQALPSASFVEPEDKYAYALCLAIKGDKISATGLMREAYSLDPTLQDGLSLVAEQYIKSGATAMGVALLLEDYRTERQSTRWQIKTAAILSSCGHIKSSTELIKKTYAKEPDAVDGSIALLASLKLDLKLDITNSLVPQHIIKLIETDLQSNRFTSDGACKALRVLRRNSLLAAEIALAEKRFKMDLATQWNYIESLTGLTQSPQTAPVLGFQMQFSHASDILVQYREIILQEQYHFLTSRNDPFIIDGGADAGMAIAYFKWLYPACRIVAFEPNPDIYEICKSNVYRNKWKDVTLLPYALSDTDGPAAFRKVTSSPMASTLTQRLPEGALQENIHSVPVETRRLSEYIREQVDFLKLDIEGMEAQVLSEIRLSLPSVYRGFIEYHYAPESASNPLHTMLAQLTDAGFCYRIAEQPSTIMDQVLCSAPTDEFKNWSTSIFFGRNTKTGQR